jgi:hypothetical protein
VKKTRLIAVLAFLGAANACASQRAASTPPTAPTLASSLSATPQLPLLFVVDGVKYQREQVPALTADQISAVRVIKGHTALEQYGADASYGVVVITTKQAAVPRS